jgi:hypothetical protein
VSRGATALQEVQLTFDISRLRKGEIVAAAGAILLFVFMFFFSWYGVGGTLGKLASAAGVSPTVDGWHGHSVLRWLMLLTIVAALTLAFLTATQRTVALPVTLAVVVTALAGLLTVLLAYRVVINEPGPNDLIDVKIGAWLGLISSGVIAYGGYLAMRDEGTSLSDARDQAVAAGQQARAAFESAGPPAGEASSPPPSDERPAGPPPPAEPVAPSEPPIGSGAPPSAAPPSDAPVGFSPPSEPPPAS